MRDGEEATIENTGSDLDLAPPRPAGRVLHLVAAERPGAAPRGRGEIDRRRKFSLTRARASGGRLTFGDRLRASVFSSLIGAAVMAAGATMRIRTRREADLPAFRRMGPGPRLFALWHGDFFPILYYCRNSGACVIVSRSPDGELLARILTRFGYRTVRGSSARGATRAMVDLTRVVSKGHDAAVAIDGPRGPRLEAKAGLLLLAKRTGCPIVPLGAAMAGYKEFRSWDRFRFPYPFSRAVLVGASPILVPHDATPKVLEAKRLELQQVMHAIRRQAQDLVLHEDFRRADRPLGYKASWSR